MSSADRRGLMRESEIGLDQVVITDALPRRSSRPADYAAENAALRKLIQTLAESPETILQRLVETTSRLCRAGSAGIDLEETDGGSQIIRSEAVTGEMSPYLGFCTPRSSSPSCVPLDRNSPQLLEHPERRFSCLRDLHPRITELLLTPIYRGDRPIGTLWVASHDDARRFDAEDARLATSLSALASAAVSAYRTSRGALSGSEGDSSIAQRYRALFQSIDEGFCVIEVLFDPAGKAVDYRFIDLNPAFEKHTGLRDARGKTMRQLEPKHEEPWFEIYGKVATTGEPIRFVHQAKQLNGRWLDLFATRLGDASSRQVAVIFRDITDRLKSDLLLRESESHLQLAVEIAQMGTFEIDLATDRVKVNETGRRIYGWGSTETTFADVQRHFHPEDKDRVLRSVAAAMDPESARTFEVEQRIVRTDGQIRWLRVRGRALFDSSEPPRPIRCVGTYIDITERQEAEETLRDADRRKDEFLAILAHELRNPLAPIRNGLQVMRLAEGNAEITGLAREVMERQLSHMVRLIDDLLDVSRISRGKMELRRSRVLLSDVLSNALETARPAIDAAGHHLTVSMQPEPVYLEGDLTRLAQVFANLLSNSIKYTPPGGQIWLTAECDASQAVISIRDNGVGIPEDSLLSIFDMFSQVDRSLERTTGGLGIGLSLVKGLVALHGGVVTAASAGPGGGSTFTVRLPMLPRDADDSFAPAIAAAAVIPARRVLVVDDNRDSADSLATMLRLGGSEVAVAYDGVEAVEVGESFRPQVVLIDISMPRMNGYEATRRIRAKEWGRGITIIALSGLAQASDLEQSAAAGCDDHLVKPVDPQELQRRFADMDSPQP